jgi:hypothetical protein
VTREQLGGNDYALRLLLPADDTPAAERGAALAAWCDGFLYGLGLAGEDALDSLSAEAREFINDITEFIQVDTDIEESDDADAALMEIAEYVRVGVHMVYQELASPEDSGDLPAGAVRH